MQHEALVHPQQPDAEVVLDGVVRAELGGGEDRSAGAGDDPAFVEASESAWGGVGCDGVRGGERESGECE